MLSSSILAANFVFITSSPTSLTSYMQSAMRKMNWVVEEEEVTHLFEEADVRGKGKIKFQVLSILYGQLLRKI